MSRDDLLSDGKVLRLHFITVEDFAHRRGKKGVMEILGMVYGSKSLRIQNSRDDSSVYSVAKKI